MSQAARQLIAGLGQFLRVIALALGVLACLALALIVIGIGTIYWLQRHPQIAVPLEGTDLTILYRHYENVPKPREHLALAETSAPDKLLAQAAWFIHKRVGVDIWRTPDRGIYYLFLQTAVFSVDVANRTLRHFEFPRDTCPSDATAPKWPMLTTEPSRFSPPPADLVFVGSIRNDEFTPADRLPPRPAPRPRRNCAAEALAWSGGTSTALAGTDLTIGLQLRWLPGHSLLYEVSVAAPGWTVASANGDPPPRTTALPPRVRLSLYRDRDMVHLLDDDETPSLRHMRLSVASRGFGEPASRPVCRGEAAPPPQNNPDDVSRPSQVFDGWIWLGRFETRFEPTSEGRWDGRVEFVPAATASEGVLAPERFCAPKER